MKNRKLIVIDGSSMLSTSYHGNLPIEMRSAKTDEERAIVYKKILQTKSGEYTNGIFGFLKNLFKIIETQNPSHIAVVWDVSRDSFRRNIYSEYKGTRKETQQPLKEQFIRTQQVLAIMGIKCYMSPEFEADDYAGTLAKKFQSEIPVYLHSKDEDYLQLVDENIALWLQTTKLEDYLDTCEIKKSSVDWPDNCFEFTPERMLNIKKFKPIQLIDYKAICGDTSDNIPGVKNVGEKAVVPLLGVYETIEEIYAFIDEQDGNYDDLNKHWKSLGVSRSPVKNMIEHRDTAFMSKALATIKTDIEILDTLEDLVYSIDEEATLKELESLEMKSLINAIKRIA